MNFAEMLAHASARLKGDKPQILPEAAVARIKEHATRYAEMMNGPRFKVGDWVTPISDSCLKAAGTPQLVVEIRTHGLPFCDQPAASVVFGAHNDTRVLRMKDGDVAPFWVESFMLEAWTPPTT